MMKFINYKLLLVLLCICASNPIEAQVQVFEGILQNNKNYSEIKDSFSQYDIYEIESENIVSFIENKRSVKSNYVFNLQLGDKYNWKLSLFDNDIRTDNYVTTILDTKGKRTELKRANITYKGFEGIDNEVRLAITENFISGFVKVNDEEYYIEPLQNFTKSSSRNLYVVYNRKHVISDTGSKSKCIVAKANEYEPQSLDTHNDKSNSMNIDCLIVKTAIANDFEMYLDYGSSVQNVINQNFATFNIVQSRFAHDFDISIIFLLTEQFFNTSPLGNPWGDLNTCTPVSLGTFRTWADNGGFSNTFDFASLWTGRDLTNAVGCTFSELPIQCQLPYQILENSNTASRNQIRQAHEYGHYFRGGTTSTNSHNSPPENRIMDATATNDTRFEWSTSTKNIINSRIPIFIPPCLFDCNCQEEATVSNTVTTSQNSQAFSQLNVRSRINSGASATYKAGTTVILGDGFHARSGSTVSVFIGECSSTTRNSETRDHFTNREVENVDVLEKVVSLYPNPVQDILHVESDEDIVSIEITNQIGVLKERRNTFLDARKEAFNVSDYKTGIYFIVITFKDGSTLNKTMIKK